MGASYALASAIVALAVVLRPVMVRTRGCGVLALATTLVGIVSIAADLGVGSAIAKFVAGEADSARKKDFITSACSRVDRRRVGAHSHPSLSGQPDGNCVSNAGACPPFLVSSHVKFHLIQECRGMGEDNRNIAGHLS